MLREEKILNQLPHTEQIQKQSFYKLDNSNGFVTSKFRGDEIHEFNAKKQHLWVEILNKSYEDNLKIKKNSLIGFVVIEPEHLLHKHATTNQKEKKKDKQNIGKQKLENADVNAAAIS